MQLMNRKARYLVPSDTAWQFIRTALRGAWKFVSDYTAHDRYQTLVESKVIRDDVLSQAHHGSMMIMSLFQNLENPLWKQYEVDLVQFMRTIGPALESYHDTLGRLVQELPPLPLPPPRMTLKEEEEEGNDEETIDLLTVLKKASIQKEPNVWRQQARDNPQSLAARFQKMVSNHNLDDHFQGARLYQALNSLGGRSGGSGKVDFIPGSVRVNNVALIHAKVREVWHNENDEHGDDDLADDKYSAMRPVVARLDVLYELTQTYKDNSSLHPLSTAAQYKAIHQDSHIDVPQQQDTSLKDSQQTPPATETSNLATTDNKQEQPLKPASELYGSSTTQKSQHSSFEEFLAQESKDENLSTSESNDLPSSSSPSPSPPPPEPRSSDTVSAAAEDLISKVNTIPKTNVATTETMKVSDQAASVEKQHNANDLGRKDDSKGKVSHSDDPEIGTITETTLAVAVIEGFLQGGPEYELRWKIARIRDASEFQ
jgi:hypothetical protein